jgi:lysophospholipase L1-like esterase
LPIRHDATLRGRPDPISPGERPVSPGERPVSPGERRNALSDRSQSRPAPSIGRRILFRLLALAMVIVFVELLLQFASLFVSSPRDLDLAGGTSDELRILCVGDSNTFGVFVEPDESYPALLAKLLEAELGRPVKTINVGHPGKNTAAMRNDLPEQLELHRPDIVILLGGANNNWNALETDHWGRPGRVDGIDRALSRLRLYKLARLVALAIRDASTTPDQAEAYSGTMDKDFLYRVTRDDVAEMARFAGSVGVQPVVQSYFQLWGYFPLFSAALEEAAREGGALFIDHSEVVEEGLKRIPREEFYFDDGHLRAPGYEVIATNLARELARHAPERDLEASPNPADERS